MAVRDIPFTPDQIGTGRVRFPSGAPIPTITDMAVDPYVNTRIPKETLVEGIQFWPQVKGIYPGVVLLHDSWGLNNQIKDLGNRLACEGFTVLVPNLYNRLGGMVTANADVAEALSERLNEPLAMQDINSCCEYLNTRDYVKRNLHAVIGFGLGGTLATRFACQRKRLRAAVSFHGRIVPAMGEFPQLYSPLLYHRAEQDASVTADDVEQLRQAALSHKKIVEILLYADAKAGFCDDTRKDRFHAGHAQTAWDATVQFLTTHLQA
ncbi:hypothetical protein YTPLAS18_19630 [Nitrospira sp.]|nr:hypothetical protein YTPLAS18_19630 [Nitrospira sp.]